MSRFAALLLCCCLQAQTPVPSAAEPAAPLLARLADHNVPLVDARGLVRDLIGRDQPVRVQLAETLARRYADCLRAYEPARGRLHAAFLRHVPKAQRQRLGRKGDARVEQLRDQILAISRAPDLSKERIQTAIDPAFAELRALFLPGPDEVIAEDPALAAAVSALRRQLGEVRSWHDLWLQAVLGPDGDTADPRLFDAKKPPPEPPPYAAVDDDLAMLCLAGLPLSTHDQRALTDNAALSGRIAAEELAGTLALNRIRIVLGLPVLAYDEKLGNAARDHSRDMLEHKFFSHESPVEGKRTPSDRAARAGTSGGAENIAAGHDTGEGAIRAWWYSPGHHKNMLGGHARTGLGQCEHLWTQMFGG